MKVFSLKRKVAEYFKRFRKCDHLFKAKDMQNRDASGNVKWLCSKCRKVFIEECGLDVLAHGECDGKWADTF